MTTYTHLIPVQLGQSYSDILQKTQGSWAKTAIADKKLEKKRHAFELAASQKHKNAW